MESPVTEKSEECAQMLEPEHVEAILADESEEEYPTLKKLHKLSFKRRNGYLAAAALFIAVLLAVFLLYWGGAQGASARCIIINEIVSSNCMSLVGPDGSSPDWIEFYNRSGNDINLQGYALAASLDGERFALGDVTIPAHGYALVYAESGNGASYTGFSLPRNGEALYLFDPSGSALECVNVPALFTDVSCARCENGSFGCCLCPTPGAANDTAIETIACYEELAKAASLVITEVMPDPSSGSAWVELYNAGGTQASLGVFYLADDAADISPHRLPDVTLEAGEYVLVYAADTAEALSVPFRFGADDHGAYLFDVTGALRSALTWEIFPGKDTAVVAADTCTKMATPGAANSADVFYLNNRTAMDGTDPVRINEVLVSNAHSIADLSGKHNAWAEVCNVSDEVVPLSGYYLSDDAGNPLKWAFPDMTLTPGDYAVVFLSGKAEQPSELHASFCIAADESALYLTDSTAMRTDTFTLPAEQADDVSFGRAEDGGSCCYANPSPGADNAIEFSSLSAAEQSRTQGVYINEVCATGGETDWIELYNGSGETADLTGWYLSDDADDPLLWQLPALMIEAGGYAVIEAGGADADAAPFGIAVSGETITLTSAGGTLIDAMDTGALRIGLTSGRAAGGASLSRVLFTEPTPGAQNSDRTASGYAATPMFSVTGLYHTEAFSLEITTPAADAAIYYTLDGSEPDNSDTLYTGAVTIADNAAVRAVSYVPGLMPSDTATATYLFEEPHTLPVFCLTGEPSEMNKIFNKARRYNKPEYAANVEYYETGGTLGVSFPAELKSKGRSSVDYKHKSVTIRLKGEYGLSEVTYPFFEDGSVTTFSQLTLRTGAQDMFAANLRDAFVQKMAQGLYVDSLRTRYVAVYVNGEYWGLYSMDEEQEEGYFEAYYGVGLGDIELIDRNNTVIEGSSAAFLEVRRNARRWNLSDDEVFADFAELVDVDACMDFLIVNTYFGNGDVINQRFWHTTDGAVKWRPLLFDLDWSMRANDASRNTFRRYFSSNGSVAGNGAVTYMDIFYGLKRNAAWREKFINRYIELAYTKFDTDRLLAIYDETVATMEPEMTRQIARWHTHRSVSSWRKQTDALRRALEKRRDIVLKQMARSFGISDTELQTRIDAYLSVH